MKKTFIAVLSLLMVAVLLVMPLVVSASTALEKEFDPVTTMWYSVDYVRTDAENAADDAYVYTWTPEADGELTLEPDTEYKDTLITVTNLSDDAADDTVLKYYPGGGFTSKTGVTCGVKAGDKYEISVMTCSEASGTVAFFAYYTQTTETGMVGAGTYSNPYIIDNTVKGLPAMEAGKTLYYLYACDKTLKYDLTVKSVNAKDSFDLKVENNKATASSANGSVTVKTITPFAASGYIMFSITNTNETKCGGFTYSVKTAAASSSKGTYEDPAPLVLDTLTTADISSVCYYYTYTATEDGTLSVNVESADNWVCSISGGVAESAFCSASDEPQVNPVEYPVNAGEEISLWVATEEYGAGTVSFTATFLSIHETTVTEPTEVITTVVTDPVEVTTVATDPVEVTTVATDPVEVTTVATDPVEATTVATDPVEVTTVATDPVVTTTVATEPVVPTTVATEPKDEEGAFVDINEEYCLSVTPLKLGDNNITISKVYPYTLFEFTPSEYAEYTITASDKNARVGAYAGTINYIPATAAGVSDSFTISFTSGMDIIIAVNNTSSCTLSIVKSGDVEIKEETQWNVYENKYNVTAVTTDIDVNALTNVMIYDEIAEFAVLGSDGYYHLSSANGEILYVNLNSNVMSLVDVVDTGKLCAVFYDEDGNVTEKIDFTGAVLEYINNAAQIVNGEEIFYFYPLTADLIEMFQVVGEASDWYGRTGWVGGLEDDAWMFACYYQEGVFTGGDISSPSNPSTIPTGRNFVIAQIGVVAMLVAANVVVFTRKKTSE